MNETAAPRDQAKDTIALSASTLGHDLVAALLAELRGMPEHWAKLNSDLQQKIIERIKDKTSIAVQTAVTLLMRSEFQAVPAKLEYVNRKDGIRAGITVNADANCRHALFDASGSQVLVVIADPAKWAARMDEIKAKDDQLELFDPAANYDPKVDQPGYRRDQDPLAPGKTWADLKKSFGVGDGTKAPEGVTVEASDRQKLYDATFRELFGKDPSELSDEERASDAALKAHNDVVAKIGMPPRPAPADGITDAQETTVAQRILQEQLAEAGVAVSLGAVKAATEAQQNEARAWVETYLSDPKACTIDRPAWLPAPDEAAPK